MRDRVKFVSYNGHYPNLCSGNLVLEIDGENVRFPEHCLSSGGSVSFTPDWDEVISHGEWTIVDWPNEVPDSLYRECIDVVNENVSQGCCGGCV